MPSRTSQIAQVGNGKLKFESHEASVSRRRNQQSAAHRILSQDRADDFGTVKGRPLSLGRYPDGIGGESFFQKNRPDWAPEWIEHVTLGEEKKDYVIATEEASLAWLANLACIELHQMHCRAPHFDKPDYIVYDFDPPKVSSSHRSPNSRWNSKSTSRVLVTIPSSRQPDARDCTSWRRSNRSGTFTKRLKRPRPLPSRS